MLKGRQTGDKDLRQETKTSQLPTVILHAETVLGCMTSKKEKRGEEEAEKESYVKQVQRWEKSPEPHALIIVYENYYIGLNNLIKAMYHS